MREKLDEWTEKLAEFRLPDWDSLPELELYMDQVVLLVTRYLSFPPQMEGDERIITASIVNNYVRMKIMPPPVKKRYSRIHIAYLLVICTLKQSLSIASIQRLMPVGLEESEVRQVYTRFLEEYATAADMFRRYTADVISGLKQLDALPTSAALMANLAKGLTEYLLFDPEEPQKE